MWVILLKWNSLFHFILRTFFQGNCIYGSRPKFRIVLICQLYLVSFSQIFTFSKCLNFEYENLAKHTSYFLTPWCCKTEHTTDKWQPQCRYIDYIRFNFHFLTTWRLVEVCVFKGKVTRGVEKRLVCLPLWWARIKLFLLQKYKVIPDTPPACDFG